ncbi:predicted protein [Botrytis cinerea T4]|uniref:Uncharacterized protein n=1 Tax=Botryotinia fuckeliana (strain T4) TaxID=999810 RepID=G2XYP8_BOTF4|nr:predicted protein [Botrytis cinerea T4]
MTSQSQSSHPYLSAYDASDRSHRTQQDKISGGSLGCMYVCMCMGRRLMYGRKLPRQGRT